MTILALVEILKVLCLELEEVAIITDVVESPFSLQANQLESRAGAQIATLLIEFEVANLFLISIRVECATE